MDNRLKEPLLSYTQTSLPPSSSKSEPDLNIQQKSPSTGRDKSILHVFCLVNTAQILSAVLNVLVKDMFTNRGVSVFEFAFARSCFNAIGSGILVKLYYREAFFSNIPVDLRSQVFLRSFCGTIAFFCATCALMLIPLSIYFIVSSFSVFMTALLAYLCLGESITCFEIIAMILAVCGIIMISIAQDDTDADTSAYTSKSMFQLGLFLTGCLAAFGSMIGITTRKLKSINYAVIQFNYALMSSTIMGTALICICLKAREMPFRYGSWLVYGEMLVACALNMVMMNLNTVANQNANPATVSLFMFVGFGYNCAADYLFFTLDLTEIQVYGLGLCLASTVAAVVYKMDIKRAK